MDKRQIAKNALRIEYQKEIASELVKEFRFGSDAISSNEKGEIFFTSSLGINPNMLFGLVRFLMGELANTKAELWLLSQSINDNKNKASFKL